MHSAPRVLLAPRSPLAYTAACGARLLRRVPKGVRDGPACAGQVELGRAPTLSSPSSSFARAFASRHPHPCTCRPVYSAPPESGAACVLHLRTRRACRLSVSSAECARTRNLSSPSSSSTRAFASSPLIYPPASLVPVVSSPSYTTPHPNQAGPRTWRGCRSRVCALPAHADDGAERMCGGVVRGPRASLLARARCWADTAALPCCVRAPPISSPVPSHPLPGTLYPHHLESRLFRVRLPVALVSTVEHRICHLHMNWHSINFALLSTFYGGKLTEHGDVLKDLILGSARE
ncbi:hypothetical protein C8F04DRAFT_1319391 [Mycena alexandri]|uniref:Uncharacterized protein n=1 Tax=Mycena alexandri TaxID=1745969 RepID=A0AAD6WQN7_9AGAR|nr:hypothetical protein C8F04DRAFT_1319391 [Mycena alexandri]